MIYPITHLFACLLSVLIPPPHRHAHKQLSNGFDHYSPASSPYLHSNGGSLGSVSNTAFPFFPPSSSTSTSCPTRSWSRPASALLPDYPPYCTLGSPMMPSSRVPSWKVCPPPLSWRSTYFHPPCLQFEHTFSELFGFSLFCLPTLVESKNVVWTTNTDICISFFNRTGRSPGLMTSLWSTRYGGRKTRRVQLWWTVMGVWTVIIARPLPRPQLQLQCKHQANQH